MGTCVALFVLALLPQGPPPPVPAPGLFVEGFQAGTNVGGWSFFGNPSNPIEVIEPAGGNPGAFLHSTCGGLACLDTFAPMLRTEAGVASPFTGDYRARAVRALGVDVRVFGPPGVSTGSRPLTLVLTNDAGTPDDPIDDVAVYRKGANIPTVAAGWKRFRFAVPSQRATLPPGWIVLNGTGDDDADWRRVLGDVSQVTFELGDPDLFYIFQQWELGVDDLRIRQGPTPR